MKIFLLRHATPDWSRKDIPYDILPGPELLPKGEKEAAALGEFLKPEGIARLYYSPFERSAKTARIIAAANGIPCVEEKGLAEWRGVDEHEAQVRARMLSIFQRAVNESVEVGPIGLVSHGGPIALLLEELGMNREELAPYRKMFDTTNPLPPAGAWKVEQVSGNDRWGFQLFFTPGVNL
jgi:broad specificity phosphatase PhoE